MRNSRPQLLEALFDEASTANKEVLHSIQQRAIALAKLNQAVKELLPPQLHPWCRVANLRQGTLVLETTNASWMMRLRYEQSHLLSALRAQILPSLSSIDIRINPALMAKEGNQIQLAEKKTQNSQPESSLRHLSQESADELRRLAARSSDCLRKKLERLAALAGKSQNCNSNK